jgi:tRNA1Val (adenine37-N6)-methyltransferase
MSNDFFRFKQFTVHQTDSAMKVGTDGVLLGAWHAIDGHPSRILDVGTGTGLIALMLAQRFNDAQVTGVEIDGIAAAEAQRNVAASPFAGRMDIINAAFQDFQQQAQTFDLIVSNPPYFCNALENPDTARATARHTSSLSFRNLLYGSTQLLDNNGRLAVILPTESLKAFLSEASIIGLSLIKHTAVKTVERKEPSRHMLLLSKQYTVAPFEETVCLQNPDGTRSEWYQQQTQDFYLSRT